jgi:hypothetical protein
MDPGGNGPSPGTDRQLKSVGDGGGFDHELDPKSQRMCEPVFTWHGRPSHAGHASA